MGKTKPDRQHSKKKRSFRNVPLDQQLAQDKSLKSVTREKKRRRKDEDDAFVEQMTSRRILDQAKKQLQELEDEHEFSFRGPVRKKILKGKADESDSDAEEDETNSNDDDDDDDEGGNDLPYEMDVAAEEQFAKFANSNVHLIDIINEKRTEIQSQMSDTTCFGNMADNSALVKLYRDVGQFLSRYRAGKIPKLHKTIPRFRNWEEILELTSPDKWTAAAMRETTRIFVSNFKPKQVERFINRYLLPRIRDDITCYGRLNQHLHMALKKALFKAQAFMAGFLIPLCRSGTVTNQEAKIVRSILSETTIPMLDSAVAMMEIAKMPYSGPNCLILEALIDKKYSLPLSTVTAIADYFVAFKSDENRMTVVWHQCLLTFAQRYKQDLTVEQKESVLQLIKVHHHHEISDEIRRELVA